MGCAVELGRSLLVLICVSGLLGGCTSSSISPVAPERVPVAPPEVPVAHAPPLEIPEFDLTSPQEAELERTFLVDGGPQLEAGVLPSVSELRFVEFRFNILGGAVGDQATLQIDGPGGLPYDKKEASLVGHVDEQQQLAFILPIAGTVIQDSGMSGTWHSTLSINGLPVLTRDFGLAP